MGLNELIWVTTNNSFWNPSLTLRMPFDCRESGLVAHAIRKGRKLNELVPRWINLAKQNERQVNQILNLLKDLEDPIPPCEELSERAFWVD